MIIVKVMGGLGNQLFQYAAGRSLSLERGVELGLDPGDLRPRRSLRRYHLDRLHVHGRMATAKEIARLRGRRTLLDRVKLRPFTPGPGYVRERKGWCYDPQGIPSAGELYLDGYWQSERYFARHRATLLTELRYRGSLSPEDQLWAQRLAEEDSVALFCRRGDYVTDPGTRDFYGLLGRGYYDAGLEVVRSRVPGLRVYWFTDDPGWVGNHLAHPDEVVVSNGVRDPLAELHLAAQARNFVVANSTFGWWGGWLGARENSVVVAPERWLAAPVPCEDIIPDWWVRVPRGG